jgi:hypothetical protein
MPIFREVGITYGVVRTKFDIYVFIMSYKKLLLRYIEVQV